MKIAGKKILICVAAAFVISSGCGQKDQEVEQITVNDTSTAGQLEQNQENLCSFYAAVERVEEDSAVVRAFTRDEGVESGDLITLAYSGDSGRVKEQQRVEVFYSADEKLQKEKIIEIKDPENQVQEMKHFCCRITQEPADGGVWVEITKDEGGISAGTAFWLDCNRAPDNERLLSGDFQPGCECKVYYYHNPSDNTVWISRAEEQIVLLE